MDTMIYGKAAVVTGRRLTFSKSLLAKNSHLFGATNAPASRGVETPDAHAVSRSNNPAANQASHGTITTDEDKLNKTEKRWLAVLRVGSPGKRIGIQDHTIKFGHDLRFTPDFTHWDDEVYTLDDVKGGKIWEDSTIKIKACAALHPRWRFRVVQWLREENQWKIKVIKA